MMDKPQTMDAIYGLPAPAKLNLFLHVIGRREDKKHLLESVFVLIDRSDLIDLERLDTDTIERVGDVIGDPEQDLCVRAARLLKERYSIPCGVRIRVTKRIPSGAGMGGGSSDAATTLIGLNRLFGLGLDRTTLMTLGVQLGADVPFFLYGRSAFVEGIGEKMSSVNVPSMQVAVVWPGKSVSTAEIFSSPALTRDTLSTTIRIFADAVTSHWPTLYGHNDLQPVAIEKEPAIARALEWLSPFTEPRMTGSGSAVFGILSKRDYNLDSLFSDLPETWIGFVAESLSEHPLAQWLDEKN